MGLRRNGEVPDVALVHLGTNDLTKQLSQRSALHRAEGAEAISRRVVTILQRLCDMNPRVQLVLAMPIPYCRFTPASAIATSLQRSSRRRREGEYASALRRACQQWSSLSCSTTSQLVCVNMSETVRCDHLVADGVHPALAGAARMAHAWFQALMPWLHLPMKDTGVSRRI